MAEFDDTVLQPTGLTPIPEATPEPALPTEPAPAAPPAPAGEAEDTEPPADGEGSEETQQTTEQTPVALGKPPRGVQKALDRLAGQASEWKNIAQTQAQIIQTLKETLSPPQATQALQPPTEKPDPLRDNFKSWEDWQAALTRHNAAVESRQVVRAELGQFAEAMLNLQQQEMERIRQGQLQQNIRKAIAEGEKKIPDWKEAVVESELPMTAPIYNALASVPNADRVMHHLATHPDEHMELTRLTLPEVERRIGFIAGSLQGPPAPSKAPAPAKPVGGRATPSQLAYSEDFTPAQHKQWLARVAQRS